MAGLALLVAAGISLLLGARTGAVGPYSPQADVRLWDPNPASASGIITTTWVGANSPALGTWSLDIPVGWSITSGGAVPVGNAVAEAAMSVDVDCNGTIDEFGPITLTNQPIDPQAVADWTGMINPWWVLTVSVDGTAQQGYELSADLTTISQPHAFCAPQVFALTLLGRSSPNAVQLLGNPGAGSYTFTMLSVSRGGAYAADDPVPVSIAPTTLPATDVDGDGVIDELLCGGDPWSSARRPERTDGAFGGVDDNSNGLADEMPAPGASNSDCDGDGYNGAAESNVFGTVRGDQDPCGTSAWPSDFVSGNIPDSTDRVTVSDLTSFLAPTRRINTSSGDAGFNVRWDILPGKGLLAKTINVADLTSLIAGTTGAPPMLGGASAFNGPICPWAGGPGPTPTPPPPTASPTASPTPTPTPTPTPVPTPTASPSPTPVATATPTPLPNGDGDGDGVIDEAVCGSDPNNSGQRPERLDGVFANRDDDGDTLIDEPLPAGAAGYDCDGDGYTGTAEDNVFGAGTRRDQDPCGVNGWPSDFVSGGIPDSTNRITVTDMTSFLAPVRRLGTNPGDGGFSVRWDLAAGKGVFATVINVSDLTSLLAGSPGQPPMLLGARAFGSQCPWAP